MDPFKKVVLTLAIPLSTVLMFSAFEWIEYYSPKEVERRAARKLEEQRAREFEDKRLGRTKQTDRGTN